MKILINLLTFNKTFTGAGYYVIRLLNIIKDLDHSNQYVLLVNKESKMLEFLHETENIKFHYINSPTSSRVKRVLFEQFILPFKLLSIKYDIFFSPNPVLPLISLQRNKKYVCTIHDLTPLIIKKDNFAQKIYYRYMTFLSAKKANKIISVSHNTKKDIVNLFKIDENKIDVIYNFLEKNYNKNVNYSDINEQYFLFVGNIHLGKNLLNLIKAFSIFKKSTKSPIKLYIVGKDGFGAKKIYEEVELKDLANEVKFLGFVSDDSIKSYYKNAFALVFPSFYEGFGYPPLESMAFDVLPIVSNISSIPEVVGDAGIYFDPYSIESISSALEYSIQINTADYIGKMRKQVQKFDGQKQCMKLLDLFAELYKSK